MFRRTLLGSVLLVSAVMGLAAMNIVGFHRPKIIRDQPFSDGIRIIRRDGDRLECEGGRVIVLSTDRYDPEAKTHLDTGDCISIRPAGSGTVVVFALVDGWVCGTRWAQPIVIPLFADITYQNRIEPIAEGSISTIP